MPILSTHEIAKNKAEIRYREHDGTIHHDDGNETQFIAASGVYFVKLFLPRKITQGRCQTLKGFVRQE